MKAAAFKPAAAGTRTGRASSEAAPLVRAPQRRPVAVDLAEWPLRMLMVEQCRTVSGWATYYRGTRGELQAAGVPAEAFPDGAGERRFELQTINVCSSGRREKLQAVMAPGAVAGGFELAVYWNCSPYMQASHPALHELARLLSIDAGAWLRLPGDWDGDEAPIARLVADPRSSYKPATVPRLRFSRESRERLSDGLHRLFAAMLHEGEIMPIESDAAAARPADAGLRLVQGGAA